MERKGFIARLQVACTAKKRLPNPLKFKNWLWLHQLVWSRTERFMPLCLSVPAVTFPRKLINFSNYTVRYFTYTYFPAKTSYFCSPSYTAVENTVYSEACITCLESGGICRGCWPAFHREDRDSFLPQNPWQMSLPPGARLSLQQTKSPLHCVQCC